MTGIISLQMSSGEVLTALVVRVSGPAEVTAARTARTPWWFAATSLAPGFTPPESRRRAPAPWPCCSHPDEVASELLASPSTRFQPGPRCQRNSERPPPSRWVPFAVALDCAASDAMNDDSVEPELGRPPLLRAIRVEAMEVITRSHQQAFVTRVEVPEIAAKRDTARGLALQPDEMNRVPESDDHPAFPDPRILKGEALRVAGCVQVAPKDWITALRLHRHVAGGRPDAGRNTAKPDGRKRQPFCAKGRNQPCDGHRPTTITPREPDSAPRAVAASPTSARPPLPVPSNHDRGPDQPQRRHLRAGYVPLRQRLHRAHRRGPIVRTDHAQRRRSPVQRLR